MTTVKNIPAKNTQSAKRGSFLNKEVLKGAIRIEKKYYTHAMV